MKLYGLIGRPLKHSFSAAYFNNKFATEGIAESRYQNFELESIEQLPKLLQQQPELVGLNVTIPYKKEVLSYLNETDAAVEQIGACNCIKIVDGKLHGFNTDYIGFTHSLQQHCSWKWRLGLRGTSRYVKKS